MPTINFYIQSNNNPAGIYVRFKEGRTIDAKAKTKFAIDPLEWSSTKGQPKSLKDETFKKLNENLMTLKQRLLNYYNISVADKPINSQWLKEFLTPEKTNGTIPKKLLEYFEYYALHKKSELAASTYTKLNVNKHMIERFQKATKKEY